MANEQEGFRRKFTKRIHTWVIDLIAFIDELQKGMVSDILSRQLIRSGTSILGNYAESESASSKKDFINFLTHALKSANESVMWLNLIGDTKRGNQEKVGVLKKELDEIAKILSSSILTLKGK